MKEKFRIILALIIPAVLAFPPAATALEKMSDSEMESVTAQAGISAALDEAAILTDARSIIFRDRGTTDANGNPFAVDGYTRFDIRSLSVFDYTFTLDIGGLYSDQITLFDQTPDGDVTRYFDHPLNGTAMISITNSAGEDSMFLWNLENISVYDHAAASEILIGDIDAGLRIFESRLDLFSPENGCGIRGTGGARLRVGALAYENPDQTGGVSVIDIMAGASFSGDPHDPALWAFDEGIFRVGIPYYYHDDPAQVDEELATYPFSFDVGHDSERTGDFQTYIALNLPVQGSVRVGKISSDSFDMGPVAIDGIRLYKNLVEFPGRGIGN